MHKGKRLFTYTTSCTTNGRRPQVALQYEISLEVTQTFICLCTDRLNSVVWYTGITLSGLKKNDEVLGNIDVVDCGTNVIKKID